MLFRIIIAVFLLSGFTACGSIWEDEQPAPRMIQQQESIVEGDLFPAGQNTATQEYFINNVGDRVLFGFDSAMLSDEAQSTLQRQALWLQENPNHSVTIEGHCDERGTREYNLALGERRASAARNYLISLGIDAGRISTISYGKERPAMLGSYEEAWAQNRRAMTVISNF